MSRKRIFKMTITIKEGNDEFWESNPSFGHVVSEAARSLINNGFEVTQIKADAEYIDYEGEVLYGEQ